jgi:integrase
MTARKTTDRRINFTDKKINHLKPEEKFIEYFDSNRKSGEGAFGLRVSPKGKKVWFAMYKAEGDKIKRFSLGTYPQLSLSKAREECNHYIAENKAGNDPQEEKQRRKAAPTMEDLWNAYKEALSTRKKPKSDRWFSEEKSRWKNIVQPAIGHIKVEDVTPAHLSSILAEKAKVAPVSANRLHGFLRQLFKPALSNGWIKTHPMQWIDKPGGSEPSRKRTLSDDEIKTLWPYFDKLPHNPRDAFKIGLYTAQRPGEILAMKWLDIDWEKAIWTQETNKTDVVHLVPLSRQVLTILRERKEWLKTRSEERNRGDLKKNPWVFPSRYNTTRQGATGTGRYTGTKDARRKLQEWSGIEGWTSHDLRRTSRSIMSRLKIKHHIRERCLNHSQSGVSEVYDRYDYLQEKTDALQKLANEIDRVRGAEISSGKVHKLAI